MMQRTPLYDLHRALGAKFVGFAGYDMPVQFADGIIAEHIHTRSKASLFDVSHMGQVRIEGPDAATALETLVPSDIVDLAPGQVRYTALTNEAGGMLDDLTVANAGDHLSLVVNASRKAEDVTHLRFHLGAAASLAEDRALLALQGPLAATVLDALAPGAARLGFMQAAPLRLGGADGVVTRSGYTGEDGFEISLRAEDAERVARLLLADAAVKPAGLGARDSLRLEAGLCLYGHDIDEETTPIEAGLGWIVAKRRRAAGGFPGAATILRQLSEGVARWRVGIRPEDRAIARADTVILDAAGAEIGTVTSGGFSPVLNAPIAMGYVAAACAAPGTPVGLRVRGTVHAARIVSLPFVPHRYYRG